MHLTVADIKKARIEMEADISDRFNKVLNTILKPLEEKVNGCKTNSNTSASCIKATGSETRK